MNDITKSGDEQAHICVGFFLALNTAMIEWMLIVYVSVTGPEFEIWGGYQHHASCLVMQEKLALRYQQKKQPAEIQARCQPVMAVQLEPKVSKH